MLITSEILEEAKSVNGGYTREQVELLGVPWPPPQGWRDSIMGRDFSDEALARFVEIRNTKKKPKKHTEPVSFRSKADIIRDEWARKQADKRSKRKNASIEGAQTTQKKRWAQTARKRLLKKDNPAEAHIRSLLLSLPVHYYRERPMVLPDGMYFIDFSITGTKSPNRFRLHIALEIDGGYHLSAEQRKKDKAKDKALLASGRIWSILRVTSDKAISMDKDELFKHLMAIRVGEIRRLK